MSSAQTAPIKCPKCGHPQDFTTWQSLNANLNPELKDRLLSGELTRFTCNECHATCEVMYPMLYHDMDRKLMVHFAAGGDLVEQSWLTKGFNGYQFRQCASREWRCFKRTIGQEIPEESRNWDLAAPMNAPWRRLLEGFAILRPKQRSARKLPINGLKQRHSRQSQ